ncbi:hypothetical protein QFC20_003740 [Naganishia adeliensis]|uniref:Uncharacterized protein n=1 Tax=Naganishia adeliensis TaxID=92952 RepID=A0ACC2W7Y0_9TREE|nr:hypothetical protein QFC20_003740 [Naganishia adeliensis]
MEMRGLWRTAAKAARQSSAPARYNRIAIRNASSTGSQVSPTGSKTAGKLDVGPPAPKVTEGPKAGNWPWRTVEADAATGKTTEERLIYSRPPSFRPKMLWFVIAAWIPASVLMADNLIRGYENEEFEAKAAAALDTANAKTSATQSSTDTTATSSAKTTERVSEDPHPDLAPEPQTVHTSTKANSMLPFVTNGQLAATAIVLAGSFMTFVSLAYPTRVITRLAQVRTRQGAQEPWKYLIKMETASNQMWAGSWKKARLIDPSRINVGLIRHGTTESPFLRVKVQPSKQDRVLGDTYTYRLDFTKLRKGDHGVPTKTPQAKESAVKSGPQVRPWEEVVISLRRVEEVFGSLG